LTASEKLAADELHRLTALSAVLQKETGNIRHAIDLMRRATQEAPTWPPHYYRLSVFLMDAEQWLDANASLDKLISLSEANNDSYFLTEARIRKILCLKALHRNEEI
jgi:hypothetical protein